MSRRFRARRVRKWMLRAIAAAVLAAVLVCVALFGYAMVLRTAWKGDRLALASIVNDAYHGRRCTLSCGNVEIAASAKNVDFFYYNILMSPDTVPIRPGAKPASDRSIRLSLPQSDIVFTPAGDGEDISVQWRQDGAEKGYTLHGVLPFSHLEQYFQNIVQWNALDNAEPETP